MMHNRIKIWIAVLICISTSMLVAQTPTDALMMDRNQVCNALIYGNSQWSEYWEGSLLRNNENIGTNINQQIVYMANYGISRKLNVIAGIPYIWTKNTAGHLAGQRGFQDLSLWLKYNALTKDLGPGKLSLLGVLGAALPSNNYTIDLLPMSIGMGCRQASLRAIADYHTDLGLYLTAQGSYIWRSNTQLDRDSYQYNGKIYYTNDVPMPNMYDYSVNLGYRKGLWNFALNFAQLMCTSGDDIRRNDMPFVANNMDMTTVGLMAKYHAKHLGFFVAGNQVIAGRNMGKATTAQAGILYAFYAKK